MYFPESLKLIIQVNQNSKTVKEVLCIFGTPNISCNCCWKNHCSCENWCSVLRLISHFLNFYVQAGFTFACFWSNSRQLKPAFHDIHSFDIIELTLCIFQKHVMVSVQQWSSLVSVALTLLAYYANMILVASFMGLWRKFMF